MQRRVAGAVAAVSALIPGLELMLSPDKTINNTHEPGPSEVLIQRGLAGILAAVSGFILGLSSCFPPLFLPLRRWAEFHTEEDALFVGSISN